MSLPIKCGVCGGKFQDCSHDIIQHESAVKNQAERKRLEEWIRQIVREELAAIHLQREGR